MVTPNLFGFKWTVDVQKNYNYICIMKDLTCCMSNEFNQSLKKHKNKKKKDRRRKITITFRTFLIFSINYLSDISTILCSKLMSNLFQTHSPRNLQNQMLRRNSLIFIWILFYGQAVKLRSKVSFPTPPWMRHQTGSLRSASILRFVK